MNNEKRSEKDQVIVGVYVYVCLTVINDTHGQSYSFYRVGNTQLSSKITKIKWECVWICVEGYVVEVRL